MEKQLVVFELASEFYGVDIGAVESIIKMQPFTRVPQAPGFVEGITNLRGSVLPVIDLRRRFGLPALNGNGNLKNTRIVVVSLDGLKVGMVVDGVSEVLRVSDETVEPPPPLVTSVDATFITGIAKIAERLVILLDLSKVLSSPEVDALRLAPLSI